MLFLFGGDTDNFHVTIPKQVGQQGTETLSHPEILHRMLRMIRKLSFDWLDLHRNTNFGLLFLKEMDPETRPARFLQQQSNLTGVPCGVVFKTSVKNAAHRLIAKIVSTVACSGTTLVDVFSNNAVTLLGAEALQELHACFFQPQLLPQTTSCGH